MQLVGSALYSKDLAFETLSNLEQRVRMMASHALPRGVSASQFSQHYQHLNESFDRALTLLSDGSESSEGSIGVLIDSLTRETSDLEAIAQGRAPVESTVDSGLQGDPKKLVADRLYDVNGNDPYLKRVSYSEDVLDAVFKSDDAIMKRAVGLILRALQRGRKFATDKSGVVPFNTDSTIFKIKIVGEAVGAIRLVGFFVGTDFHVVDWSNESSHSAHASTRLIDRARAARLRFNSARLH